MVRKNQRPNRGIGAQPAVLKKSTERAERSLDPLKCSEELERGLHSVRTLLKDWSATCNMLVPIPRLYLLCSRFNDTSLCIFIPNQSTPPTVIGSRMQLMLGDVAA